MAIQSETKNLSLANTT